MNVHKKLEREKKNGFKKIIIPFLIMLFGGYFLQVLIREGFFVGWEVYFALGCYALIFITLITIDVEIIRWMHYDMYIEEGKLRIKDGIFSRPISIPIDRLYYINSVKISGDLNRDTIFITDKRIKNKKVRPLREELLCNKEEHQRALREIKDLYPEKNFYYYRVVHKGYRFIYYFYMLYKTCERCRFSDTSMEFVKRFAEGK